MFTHSKLLEPTGKRSVVRSCKYDFLEIEITPSLIRKHRRDERRGKGRVSQNDSGHPKMHRIRRHCVPTDAAPAIQSLPTSDKVLFPVLVLHKSELSSRKLSQPRK